MNKLIGILCVFVLSACADGLERLPDGGDVMSKDKMIAVTKDMVKLESFVQSNYKNVAEYHKLMITSGDSVLRHHGVTQEQYTQSMEYYGSRQSEMQEIYSSILDDLNKELVDYQRVKEQ
jgi:hypothetical protein